MTNEPAHTFRDVARIPRGTARFRGVAGILLAMLVAAPAMAAGPEAPPDEATLSARRRFDEGVAASKVGNYDAARIAFAQAYAIKPHPHALYNLAMAELAGGRWLEAARHLSAYLLDSTHGTSQQRTLAREALVEAEGKVAKVLLDVDVSGAEVTLDGEIVGRTPVGDPYYAAPGPKTLRVRREGYSEITQAYVLEAGKTLRVRLQLTPDPPRAKAAPPVPTAAPVMVSLGNRGGVDQDEPPSTTSLRRARPWVLLSEAAVAVVGLGVGIGFSLRGSALNSDAETLSRKVAAGDQATEPTACFSPAGTAASQCSRLLNTLEDRNDANTVGRVGFVVAGVGAAAFLTTYLLWRRPPTQQRVAWAPWVGAAGGGVVAEGAF